MADCSLDYWSPRLRFAASSLPHLFFYFFFSSYFSVLIKYGIPFHVSHGSGFGFNIILIQLHSIKRAAHK